MSRLGLIADDLTGAMDTGVQLVKWGLQPLVVLAEGRLPEAQVLVISTDSRDVPQGEAYRRSARAAKRLRGRILYKKIDSTLRGNLGAELDALVDVLGSVRVLVAPAFPGLGRTTEDGYFRVHGVLLSESAFASDPLWPARESHVPTLLGSQTTRTVGHIPLSIVALGQQAVADALLAESAVFVTADATQTMHLQTLAKAAVLTGQRWLLCGSAGLAEEWPAALGLSRPEQIAGCWGLDERPVVVISGSRHATTAEQLRYLEREGGVKLVRLVAAAADWQTIVDGVAAPILGRGQSVALTTTLSPYRKGESDATAQMLGQATRWLVDHVAVSGLILTGGQIARAACQALGAEGLLLLEEVQAGIPAATVAGGPHDGLRIVAKGGGCGGEQAILQALLHIQGRTREGL
jgi:uncharacterized protein YgbK (DUF1537 family)